MLGKRAFPTHRLPLLEAKEQSCPFALLDLIEAVTAAELQQLWFLPKGRQ